MRRVSILWVPAIAVLALFAGLFVGLKNPTDHIVPSTLVGENLPEFDTLPALSGRRGASSGDFRDGRPRLLNVFASWCVPCIQEVGVLRQLKREGAEITGIAIHDSPDAVAAFLARNGDPYRAIGLDNQGRTQVAFGSTGVPETFVIDGQGKILYQHIGPVTQNEVPLLLELLEQGE